MNDLTLFQLIQLVGSLAALFGVPVILYRQGVPAADRRFSDTIQGRLEDREQMRFLEDRYKRADAMIQGTLNAAVEVIKVLAPLTSIKSDDKVAEWLDDIRTPGDPVTIGTVEIKGTDEALAELKARGVSLSIESEGIQG